MDQQRKLNELLAVADLNKCEDLDVGGEPLLPPPYKPLAICNIEDICDMAIFEAVLTDEPALAKLN